MVLIFLSMQRKKREHTYKILKEWPIVVKELHLKTSMIPKKGYNLQDKLSSNQIYIQLQVYEGIHKAAQRSLENILEWDRAFKQFEDEINRHIHFSNAADLNLVENELLYSAKELHAQKLTLISLGYCTDRNQMTCLAYRMYNPIVQCTMPFHCTIHQIPDIFECTNMSFWEDAHCLPILKRLKHKVMG